MIHSKSLDVLVYWFGVLFGDLPCFVLECVLVLVIGSCMLREDHTGSLVIFKDRC